MKTLGFVIRFILCIIGITFLSALATFFIGIFLPENVKGAFEIVKSLF